VLAIGCIAALSAIGAARTVASLDDGAQAAIPVIHAETAVKAPAAPATTAQISKGADGHYWAEAMVDGKVVRFLVDTGATAVALTADDARRLLLHGDGDGRQQRHSRQDLHGDDRGGAGHHDKHAAVAGADAGLFPDCGHKRRYAWYQLCGERRRSACGPDA
jgi:hypothetical protein